jgi:hypothetical protein
LGYSEKERKWRITIGISKANPIIHTAS